MYACDGSWWKVYYDEVMESFPGQKWTQDESWGKSPGMCHIKSRKSPGLSVDPKLIHSGGNSGYQALNLVYHFGASRILLMGYDMRGGHWHGNHPSPLKKGSPYHDWVGRFDQMASDLSDRGVEVINCSLDSALECFSKMRAEDAI